MDTDRIKNAVSWGVGLVAEFLPDVPSLYFPLLHSVCVWAGHRMFNVRKELLAVQVWLGPEAVGTKSDGFITSFFAGDVRLRTTFAPELERDDVAALRGAFVALYPVLGLEEVFLKDLFRGELERGEFRAIALGFRNRVAQAIEKIIPSLEKKDFSNGLASLAGELASLGIHLIDDDDVKDMVMDVIEDRIGSSK